MHGNMNVKLFIYLFMHGFLNDISFISEYNGRVSSA